MVTVTEQPVGNCDGSQSETAGVIGDLVMEAVPPTGSLLVFGRVGVSAKEFVGMVGVVDFGRPGAVGPAQPPAVGDLGAQFATARQAVIRPAREEQLVRIGAAAARKVR
jgi:hypothetical protein